MIVLALALILTQHAGTCRHTHTEPSVAYTQDTLMIVVSDSMRCNISLYNLLGVELTDFGTRQLRKGHNPLFCPALSRGVYIVVFRSDTLRIIKRIIILHDD